MIRLEEFLSPLMWVWLVLAFYPSILVHELGHTLVGRAVGIRVLASGIGFGRPFVRIRWRGTTFYVGRLMSSGGLTLYLQDAFRSHPRNFALFLAGGMSANFGMIVVSVLLWLLGLHIGLIKAFLTVNLLLFFISAIPHYFRTRHGARFRSDSMHILNVIGHRQGEQPLPGQSLEGVKLILDLYRSLDIWEGKVMYTLLRSYLLLSCDDYEGAEEALKDPCLQDPQRHGLGSKLQAYIHACRVFESDMAESTRLIEEELRAARDDPHYEAALLYIRADAEIQMGRPAAGFISKGLEKVHGLPDSALEFPLQVLSLLSDPPEDLHSACQRLLADPHFKNPDPLVKLRLLSGCTKVLAERGRLKEARETFALATALLNEVSDSIRDVTTRDRFLARASKPLKEAIAAAGDGIPLFIPDGAGSKTKGASSIGTRTNSRRQSYAPYGFFCGILSASIAMFWIVQSRFMFGRPLGDRLLESVSGLLLMMGVPMFAIVGLIWSLMGLRETGKLRQKARHGVALNAISLGFSALCWIILVILALR